MLPTSFDRRSFGRCLAAGAFFAAPDAIMAKPDESSPSDKRPPVPTDLILELIQHRYPHELTDEQRAEIRREIEQFQTRSRLLSAFPLVNSDEPASVFSAWRAEPKKD